MKLALELTPERIQELREVIDGLSLAQYAPLILAILPQLPLESVAATSAPLAAREVGGGIKLTAYTPRGVSMLAALDEVLGKVQS